MSTPSQPSTPFRILHTFVVHLEKTVTEKTTREENGQRITVETPVSKQVPYTIILKEPNRTQRTELAFYKDVTYGKAIKEGLMPKAFMQQVLGRADPNNPLSQEEDKALGALNRRLIDLANEHMRLSSETLSGPATEEIKQRKAEVAQEWLTLQNKAIGLIAAYHSVYDSTAERYTEAKMLTWLELFLTFVRDPDMPDTQPPRPLFPGTDYVAKDTAWGDMEEAKDPLLAKLMEEDRLASLWKAYLYGRAGSQADFTAMEEEWAKEKVLRTEAEAREREAADAEVAAMVPPVEATPTPAAPEVVAPPHVAP